MARPLAILRQRISNSATTSARYALSAPPFAPPEQAFPREYENKAGTKTRASAAAEAGMAGRDPKRRATLSRAVNDLVKAHRIIRKTVQQKNRSTIGWTILEVEEGADCCPNIFPSGRTIAGCFAFRSRHRSQIYNGSSALLTHITAPSIHGTNSSAPNPCASERDCRPEAVSRIN
jgi:hypothetical protein